MPNKTSPRGLGLKRVNRLVDGVNSRKNVTKLVLYSAGSLRFPISVVSHDREKRNTPRASVNGDRDPALCSTDSPTTEKNKHFIDVIILPITTAAIEQRLPETLSGAEVAHANDPPTHTHTKTLTSWRRFGGHFVVLTLGLFFVSRDHPRRLVCPTLEIYDTFVRECPPNLRKLCCWDSNTPAVDLSVFSSQRACILLLLL